MASIHHVEHFLHVQTSLTTELSQAIWQAANYSKELIVSFINRKWKKWICLIMKVIKIN